MNILILSCGTRNKIVQYMKRELNGKGRVICTDATDIAPALYEADGFYVVPRIDDPNYLDTVLDICKKEKIDGAFSLIDPELSLLMKHKVAFEQIGVTIIGSSYDACERTLNKWDMFCWLCERGFKTALSYLSIEDFEKDLNENKVHFPVFVKPVCGSASINISKVYDMQTLKIIFSNTPGLMIQEYMHGQEIGADCYIDLISQKLVSVFTKKKLLMRAGETDKAISFKDPKLFDLIKEFVNESGFSGTIDIDIFDVDGTYYISEVNPRFGGGYPHAYECGVNFMKYIVNNLSGEENTQNIGNYDENMVMMKYCEIGLTRK